MRRAASCGQPLHESSVPLGAATPASFLVRNEHIERVSYQDSFSAELASLSGVLSAKQAEVEMRILEDAGRFTSSDEPNHWVEHFRNDDLSVGTYSIPAGSVDDQTPHTEDEIYVV